MPKVGMEAVRKEALVRAAIGAIGEFGSLDVTVAAIARRAGVSAALAHHYFGSKDTLFLSAMRRILEDFGRSVREGYRGCQTPRDRLHALIEACFDEDQFDPAVVSAWLSFYVMAQRSPEAARLLAVYRKRLDSNLIHSLKALVPDAEARRIADGVAAMIDGYYIRAALRAPAVDRRTAVAQVTSCLDVHLASSTTPAETETA